MASSYRYLIDRKSYFTIPPFEELLFQWLLNVVILEFFLQGIYTILEIFKIKTQFCQNYYGERTCLLPPSLATSSLSWNHPIKIRLVKSRVESRAVIKDHVKHL